MSNWVEVRPPLVSDRAEWPPAATRLPGEGRRKLVQPFRVARVPAEESCPARVAERGALPDLEQGSMDADWLRLRPIEDCPWIEHSVSFEGR